MPRYVQVALATLLAAQLVATQAEAGKKKQVSTALPDVTMRPPPPPAGPLPVPYPN